MQTRMQDSYNNHIYKPDMMLEKCNRLEGRITNRKMLLLDENVDPYANASIAIPTHKDKDTKLSDFLNKEIRMRSLKNVVKDSPRGSDRL